MHLVLAVLAVIFILGGFVGLFLGVIPSLILWTLAAICIYADWRARPLSQRRRENRLAGRTTTTKVRPFAGENGSLRPGGPPQGQAAHALLWGSARKGQEVPGA